MKAFKRFSTVSRRASSSAPILTTQGTDMARARTHYVDNKQLYTEMIKYINKCNEAKKEGEPRPKVPDYVGICIMQIANRLATKPNFVGYSYKDEMIADGIENCLTYLHNFNPDKSNNPFAYFTQIIYYAFLRRIQKEKKHAYIKHKSFMNSLVANMVDVAPEDQLYLSSALVHVDARVTDLIEAFESKEQEKKANKKGIEKFIKDEDDESG